MSRKVGDGWLRILDFQIFSYCNAFLYRPDNYLVSCGHGGIRQQVDVEGSFSA